MPFEDLILLTALPEARVADPHASDTSGSSFRSSCHSAEWRDRFLLKSRNQFGLAVMKPGENPLEPGDVEMSVKRERGRGEDESVEVGCAIEHG